MLWWDRYRFDKKRTEPRYTELLFLHPVGSAGHVVHSIVFSVRNNNTLFFMLWWDRYGFDIKRAETCYADLVFLQPVGSACHVVHSGASGGETSTHFFSCSDGTGTDLSKSAPRHVTLNFGFCIRWDLQVT
jgi:hypothetical protein